MEESLKSKLPWAFGSVTAQCRKRRCNFLPQHATEGEGTGVPSGRIVSSTGMKAPSHRQEGLKKVRVPWAFGSLKTRCVQHHGSGPSHQACGQVQSGRWPRASISQSKGVHRSDERHRHLHWPSIHFSWIGILWASLVFKQDHRPAPEERELLHEVLHQGSNKCQGASRHLFNTIPVFRRQVFKAVTIRQKRIRTGRGRRCHKRLMVLFTSFHAVDSVKCNQGCTNFRIPLQEASNEECELGLKSPAQFWWKGKRLFPKIPWGRQGVAEFSEIAVQCR